MMMVVVVVVVEISCLSYRSSVWAKQRAHLVPDATKALLCPSVFTLEAWVGFGLGLHGPGRDSQPCVPDSPWVLQSIVCVCVRVCVCGSPVCRWVLCGHMYRVRPRY